jgi:site-specific recombinase XerD
MNEMDKMAKSDLIKEFESDFKSRGRTPETTLTYVTVLRAFEKFLNGKSLVAIDRRDLKAYLDSLRERDLSYQTLQRQFIVLNKFYEHLADEDYIEENPVPFVRRKYLSEYKNGGDPNVRRLLTVDEVRKLLANIINIRDQLIVLMLAKTGIRERELVSIDVNDIDFDRDNNTRPLFLSRYGTRLSPEAVLAMVKMHAARCGLHNPEIKDPSKHVGVHNFRHFFTTVMWKNGTGLPREYIKWLRGDKLGKEAMDIYLHLDQEDIRRKYLEVAPKLL